MRTTGAIVLVVSIAVLSGYALHRPILTMLHPSLQAMSVLTAAGLILLAVALGAENSGHRYFARSLSVPVLVIATALLASHTFAGSDVVNRPLTEYLFGGNQGLAGRTSGATAAGLLLLATNTLLGSREDARGANLADACAGLTALVGGLALIGYAYGVQDLYAFSPFNTMAIHTAIALILLAFAALVVRPGRGAAAVIASNLAGGGATRRQLAVTLFIPVLGAGLLRATDAQRVGPGMAMALLVSLTVAALTLLILRDGRLQNEFDRERRVRNAVLAQAKAALERDLAIRVEALNAETGERLKAEDALRQSQKMEAIGQLTGGVAHDFNNLLTVIRSSADLLARPDLQEPRRRRYIEAIIGAAERAAKLTGQLLAFARRQALKPEVFDVGHSVTAIADMVGTLTGARIRIVTQVPDEPCFIDADPSQFDTAIVNMTVNARDAMDGHGDLTITVESSDGIPAAAAQAATSGAFVSVTIADTGTGIAAGDLERIFEPFFTTKEVGYGTGLGLSQVFGFAKQSGGEVRVASKIGQGSTFTLYLPRVAGMSRAGVVAGEPEPFTEGHGTRVLLVEDNTDVGSFAVQTLTELGYVTTWAASAEDALAKLAEDIERFDVVFSDVVMPGMSGIELGQEIRRLHHDLPVVLTSGYSHVLAQNGTYGFELLHKPYSIDQLSRVLRKASTWQRRKRMLGS
ncbi:ATP-binding protein [Methylobacterium sp. J-088]|uniref:ATP-binding protein n=1 Tax=Methylobacterium sp. J-088 TaxID=2836664 RepID=UPI001FBB3692|nr:ATP-binding protein [Methylobacterium sp. J-088]MCJ2064266.1 ATP-binding protein [Methylobacterium sp. J-088]